MIGFRLAGQRVGRLRHLYPWVAFKRCKQSYRRIKMQFVGRYAEQFIGNQLSKWWPSKYHGKHLKMAESKA